jgi:serine protease Do
MPYDPTTLLSSPITQRILSGHSRGLIRALLLVLILCDQMAPAQDSPSGSVRLSRDYFKNGDATLRAFEPVSRAMRDSVVKLDLDGSTVALAAVIDANGLVITKGSEIKPGKLTGWLASGKEVEASLIGRDEENDLALVKVRAKGLKPIQWATDETSVGQWVVTPGTTEMPQAVGVISVPTRKILPPKAFIGVVVDKKSSTARISEVLNGLGAEKAGLRPGDQILAVNDSLVKDGEELIKTLRNFRGGQTAKLRVQREEQEFEAQIEMIVPKFERGGRGFDRADRMNRMGSLPSQRAEDFELAIQHDTVLQNWQCGGPLVNLEGKAIGLNIARAGRVASYALPADLVRQTIHQLTTRAQAAERTTSNLKTSQPVQPPVQ